VIGVTILGFPEKAVWRKTLRELLELHTEYKILTGLEKRYSSPDDIIPGEDVI
jgi:hypothetical protein